LVAVEEGWSDLQHIHDPWSVQQTSRATIRTDKIKDARLIGVRRRNISGRDEQSLMTKKSDSQVEGS
jgi:hypothetical protein